jgi:hypothetical protein
MRCGFYEDVFLQPDVWDGMGWDKGSLICPYRGPDI